MNVVRRLRPAPAGAAPQSHPLGNLELLESREVPAALDSAVAAYQGRADTVLDGNVAAVRRWAAAHATQTADQLHLTSDNSPSIWTAAAALAKSGSDPALRDAGYKLAAGLMEFRVHHLFVGGNDGWPAWATADTCARYHDLIRADPHRYAPSNYPANPAAADGKYSLDDLFRIVLTKSTYAPIDSTSNHKLMNATARYLAEQAYPGQVAKGYNNSTSDPTGAHEIASRAESLVRAGPAEYGSPNYGADNWGEFLSVAQLTSKPEFAALRQQAEVAYETSVAYAGAFWMDGQLAMSTARGYPSTGAWGVAAGDVLPWVYFGGDFGIADTSRKVQATDVKTLGVLGAEAALAGYAPPAGVLHLADPVDRVSKANFGDFHEYSYLTPHYSHYSESSKFDSDGGKQTHWKSRVVWTKPYDQTYQATAWINNPVTSPSPNADGTWTSVNPYTLQAYKLSGSQTYGAGPYEDLTQHLDTVLHVYNIPAQPEIKTTGGLLPARGALIYTPVPRVRDASGNLHTATAGYVPPQLSADGKQLFVGYNSVFIAFTSSAPISRGTSLPGQQFFNVFGGPVAGQRVVQDQFLRFAVAVQTASPDDYPGATLGEKFANFKAAMAARAVPAMVADDLYHPIWQYSDGTVTLTNEYQGDKSHSPGPNDGRGQDFIGGPDNANPTLIDYAKWPMLEVAPVSGGPDWAYMPVGGDLNVNFPGTPCAFYDYRNGTEATGANVHLTAASNEPGVVTLAWAGGLGQTGWKVERSTNDATWVTAAAGLPPSATGYLDAGWTQGVVYYYRVTPLGTAAGPSAPVSVAAAFSAPTGLRVKPDSSGPGKYSVSLWWTNTAVGAKSVLIQCADDGYEQWRTVRYVSPTTSSTTLTGIPPGVRRFYRVVATNGVAVSAPSNVAGTQLSPAYYGKSVSMPEYLTAAAGPGRVDLRWADTALDETGYQVERSADGATWAALASALPAGSAAYSDATATPGVAYRYRVAARSGAALSAYSNVATAAAAPPPNRPPVAVDDAATTAAGRAVVLALLGNDTDPDGDTLSVVSVTTPANGTAAVTGGQVVYTPKAGFSGTDAFGYNVSDGRGGTATGKATVTVTAPPAPPPPPVAGTGLRATYYDNKDFTGPAVARTDPAVDFNWGTGSPDPAIGADTFSARWTGSLVPPAAGDYVFRTYSDDGVRVWVGGKLVVDNWTVHPARYDASPAVALTAGTPVDVRVEYYENTREAVARLEWRRPGASAFEVVPQAVLFDRPAAPAPGLAATYYDNTDFTGATVTRTDAQINFDWGSGSPAAGIGADTFSVRWVGTVLAPATGEYTFRTYSDDGVRVTVGGRVVVDQWNDHVPRYDQSAPVTLTAGEPVGIEVEYYENAGTAVVRLEWRRPGATAFEPIPQSALSPLAAGV